jgi:transposase-like protein
MPSKNHTHQQYFLFSAKARSLSIPQVAEWDEETVFKAFRDMRWAKTGGGLYCPKCGSVAHYFSKRRRQWRCKDCGHTYSVASGTWLHSTNLPLRTILIAILLLANGAKGISALQLGRDIGVQYKTAFTLYHKLRSALLKTRYDKPAMSGEIQADGAYLNPYRRPANKAADRPDGDLEVNFKRVVVNHSISYCGPKGENTNQAESFFARFRRMFKGQIHKASVEHLALYANEVAYREDIRRWDNGRIASDMLGRMLTLEDESSFRGYWSRTNVKPAVATGDEPAGLAAAA